MFSAPPLAVYVHWPFCVSKCPYCDFNSHVLEGAPDVARWQKAYKREIATLAGMVGGLWQIQSVYFGGGTPSLMPPSLVADILHTLTEHWPMTENAEITLEANPNSVEVAHFADIAAAGVNRLSLGVQALNAEALSFLGRAHDVREALEAINTARKYFSRYSFDLIYARPGQSMEEWQEELEKALTLAEGHLSLYQLTIEKGTPFYARARGGDFVMPEVALSADMYHATNDRMKEAGLPSYEISNYAMPGEECKHNLAYWQYCPYLGIGPGAHGRLPHGQGRLATMMRHGPEQWLQAVEQTGTGFQSQEVVKDEMLVEEMVMMGLRLTEGISIAAFTSLAGQGPEECFGQADWQILQEAELIAQDEKAFYATEAGRMVLNALLAKLFSR